MLLALVTVVSVVGCGEKEEKVTAEEFNKQMTSAREQMSTSAAPPEAQAAIQQNLGNSAGGK